MRGDSKHTVTYSVRVPPHLWDAAKDQAERDGVRRNTAVKRLIQGYVDKDIEPEFTPEDRGPALTRWSYDQ